MSNQNTNLTLKNDFQQGSFTKRHQCCCHILYYTYEKNFHSGNPRVKLLLIISRHFADAITIDNLEAIGPTLLTSVEFEQVIELTTPCSAVSFVPYRQFD